MSYIEILENDSCLLIGCLGRYEWAYEGDGCSCHINPPCGYCTSSYLVCDECTYTPEEAGMIDENTFSGLDQGIIEVVEDIVIIEGFDD